MPVSKSSTNKSQPSWRLIDRLDRDLLSHLGAVRKISLDLVEPEFNRDLHDPWLLPDIAKVCLRLKRAREQEELVTIFGDYDADGTPASALLSQAFTRIGLSHQVILPKREEGYGLQTSLIDQLAEKSPLLITVDNGITALKEIDRANQRGIEVIVIDHHLPGSQLPKALIVDPHRSDSRYPFKYLCGCALVYKLTECLSRDFPVLSENFRKWQLDLVAISTVADMMPLVGENRALVHYGLKVLRRNRRVGLRSLLKQAGLKPEQLSARELGFMIGPRLNASGRLDDNRPALELLITDDPVAADRLASQLEVANQTRQRLAVDVLAEAEKLLFEQNRPEDRLLTLLHPDWPSGVIGLVAGRLTDRYLRPVVVGTIVGQQVKASARSVEKYSLIEALTSQSAYLSKFGGHRQAAGLSSLISLWPQLSSGLKTHAGKILSEADLQVKFLAEAFLEEEKIDLEMVLQLDRFGPFGNSNPRPLLIINNCQLVERRTVGAKMNHLKLKLKKGQREFAAIGFDLAGRSRQVPAELSVLGYLEKNDWQDRQSLQFRLVDYQASPAKIESVSYDEVKHHFCVS